MTVTIKEYAEALFSLALEKSKVEAYRRSLRFLTDIFKQNDDFLAFLYSPAISMEEKTLVLKRTLEENLEGDVFSFTCLLCEKGRIREIFDCEAAFEEFYLASKNISQAKVISAAALGEEEKQRLNAALEKKFGKKFQIEYEVDSSLLGGAIIKTDGTVYDGSLKRRMKDAKGVMQG